MSIAANELRIGNWVNSRKHVVCVNAIMDYPNHKLIAADGETLGSELPFREYDPIPLTPEILRAMGFVNREDEVEYDLVLPNGNGTELFIEDEDVEYKSCGIKETIYQKNMVSGLPTPAEKFIYFRDIRFLHQLQNLYFALTGTELTYNPKIKV